MTQDSMDQDPMEQDGGRQEGLGKTAGLPGDHADPRTRRLLPDETDATVAGGEIASPQEELEVQAEAREEDERGGKD